jgi:hypothetical protein
MGKKKAKRRLQQLERHSPAGAAGAAGGLHAGLGSRGEAKVLPPLPEFTAFERLLPRLILFPSDGRKLTGASRKALDRCVRLSEEILALRPEAERVARMLSLLGEADDSIQLNSLLKLVEEAAGPEDKRGPGERLLHERRMGLCREFERGIPRDLQEWLVLWDRKIDEEVGEDYLRWLSQAGGVVQKQAREWAEANASAAPGQFGIFSRIRALRASARAKKTARLVASLKSESAARRERLKAAQARVANLCGVLASFLKAPALNAGQNTRVVRKLLFLELERELSERLGADIREREARTREARASAHERAGRLRALRQYVADVEARKNLRLVELYAASCANVQEAIPAATVLQVNAAFAELGESGRIWNEKIEAERARVRRLAREMERLAGVVDEYAERHLGNELRSAAGMPFSGAGGAPDVPGEPVVRTARLDSRAQ